MDFVWFYWGWRVGLRFQAWMDRVSPSLSALLDQFLQRLLRDHGRSINGSCVSYLVMMLLGRTFSFLLYPQCILEWSLPIFLVKTHHMSIGILASWNIFAGRPIWDSRILKCSEHQQLFWLDQTASPKKRNFTTQVHILTFQQFFFLVNLNNQWWRLMFLPQHFHRETAVSSAQWPLLALWACRPEHSRSYSRRSRGPCASWMVPYGDLLGRENTREI